MRVTTQQFKMCSAGDRKQRRQDSAFTLIEVLIAVTVFAVVLAALDGIFYGAMHLQMRTTTVIQESVPIDHALTIIKRDIANMVLPTGTLGGMANSGASSGISTPTGTGLSGPISLEIYTTTGSINDDAPWGDIQKVDYSLQNSTNRTRTLGKDLVRSISRNLLATSTELPKQQRLLEDVEKLLITFYDGTNWVDTWGTASSTNTTVPAAIRFEINLATEKNSRNVKPPIELLVPVMVFPITTNT